MRRLKSEIAYWNGWRIDVHFDEDDYRIGSNTYTPNGTMCTPQKPLLDASNMWSESEFRHSMSLQEFVHKVLGD